MYLAMVKLMAYYGGDKRLAAEDTTFNIESLNRWIKLGRMTPLGADVIGGKWNIPFSRSDLRPDLSRTAWTRFDRTKDRLYMVRAYRKHFKTNRIEI